MAYRTHRNVVLGGAPPRTHTPPLTAALTGLGSGVLHALSGPDHLVSLTPISLGRTRAGWLVGLLWGVGHGAGTLLLGSVLLLVATQVHVAAAAAWAERIAGVALAGMGVHGLVVLRRGVTPAAAAAGGAWKALLGIGFVHGATGAAGLLLLLPAAASASGLHQAIYLAGFTCGSTLAMAGLTEALASASRWPGAATVVRRAPVFAASAAIALGVAWVVMA
jgi:nickel/cobalt transporter (NicO) family protein